MTHTTTQTPEAADAWLTSTDAAAALGIDTRAVLRLARNGRIGRRRIPGTRAVRLLRTDVERLATEAVQRAVV